MKPKKTKLAYALIKAGELQEARHLIRKYLAPVYGEDAVEEMLELAGL